jgi:hypothetical protein
VVWQILFQFLRVEKAGGGHSAFKVFLVDGQLEPPGSVIPPETNRTNNKCSLIHSKGFTAFVNGGMNRHSFPIPYPLSSGDLNANSNETGFQSANRKVDHLLREGD